MFRTVYNWVSTNYFRFFTSASGLCRKRTKHDSGSATKGSARQSRETPSLVAKPESCLARCRQSRKQSPSHCTHIHIRAMSMPPCAVFANVAPFLISFLSSTKKTAHSKNHRQRAHHRLFDPSPAWRRNGAVKVRGPRDESYLAY